jgi:hypothetical protein
MVNEACTFFQRSEFMRSRLDGGRTCDKTTRRAEFRFHRRANHFLTPAILSPRKGRWPSSRTLGRDAVDAAASCARRDRRAGLLVSDLRGVRTSGAEAYGEVVWSWRLSGWRQVGEKANRPDRARTRHLFAGDGDNKARFSGEITL